MPTQVLKKREVLPPERQHLWLEGRTLLRAIGARTGDHFFGDGFANGGARCDVAAVMNARPNACFAGFRPLRAEECGFGGKQVRQHFGLGN